jgi:hypothetical protein
MVILPLSNPILLRGLRTGRLMNESMLSEVGVETLVNIFTASVRTNNSEFGRKLSLDHRMK